MSGLTPQLPASALPDSFFDRDAQELAKALLGKALVALATMYCGAAATVI